tara:strand:+ start:1677 stop:1832 length:156 start_codon:yes stop_codon:yes gene_type:complete
MFLNFSLVAFIVFENFIDTPNLLDHYKKNNLVVVATYFIKTSTVNFLYKKI